MWLHRRNDEPHGGGPGKAAQKLIAYFSPERAMLREPEMMGIRGSTTANQARLFGYVLDVALVTDAAGLGMDQLALVGAPGGGRPLVRFFVPPLN